MPGTAFSANTPNYSGLLYLKGNANTPLLSTIGARRRLSKSVEFACSQSYSLPDAKIPAISPAASMTAPTPSIVTRAQDTNVTQIFHESVSVAYEKMSNMGTMSGLNVAGQQANPTSELDFQVAAKMRVIAQDIENTFINGVYHKSTSENDANQTRGLIQAITTNVLDIGGEALSLWDVADLLAEMSKVAPTANKVLWCDGVAKFQLASEAAENNYKVQDIVDARTGINVTELVTPAGTIRIVEGRYLPAGTALVLDLAILAPVEQNVPGKGNFFYETLARVGAGEQGQVFGQIGLDYGPEFYHGKLTGIKATYTRPQGKRVVVTAGDIIPVVETAKLRGATMSGPIQYKTGNLSIACDVFGSYAGGSVSYVIETADAADGEFAPYASGTAAMSSAGAITLTTPLSALTADKYVRVTISDPDMGSATTNVVYAYDPVMATLSVLSLIGGSPVTVSAYDQTGAELSDVASYSFTVKVDVDGDGEYEMPNIGWSGMLTSLSNLTDNTYDGKSAVVVATNGTVTVQSNAVVIA